MTANLGAGPCTRDAGLADRRAAELGEGDFPINVERPGVRGGGRKHSQARGQEAFEAGRVPKVILAATHESVLQIVSLEDLMRHAAS